MSSLGLESRPHDTAASVATHLPDGRRRLTMVQNYEIRKADFCAVGSGKNSVWSVFEASLVGRKNPCCPVEGLNSRRAASRLVRLVEGEERW
ncbi:hypothetical protein TNCV_267611 [Trichonephila clavipes]|nr:hypothetical protein TNCV_267611 [Trichonephila clavipes]